MAEINSTVKKEQHKENNTNDTIDIQDEFITTDGNKEGLREVQQTSTDNDMQD